MFGRPGPGLDYYDGDNQPASPRQSLSLLRG
jgi:hypothetical protein